MPTIAGMIHMLRNYKCCCSRMNWIVPHGLTKTPGVSTPVTLNRVREPLIWLEKGWKIEDISLKDRGEGKQYLVEIKGGRRTVERNKVRYNANISKVWWLHESMKQPVLAHPQSPPCTVHNWSFGKLTPPLFHGWIHLWGSVLNRLTRKRIGKRRGKDWRECGWYCKAN